MGRVAVVARLKPDAEGRAGELVEAGPPFSPGETGFERHAVYLSAGEVVFVFEGPEVEWLVNTLLDDPMQWPLNEAFEQWRPLIDGQPRIARERFFWQRAAVPNQD
jgi:hypothetical protein